MQGARGVLERMKLSEGGALTEIPQEEYDHNKIISAYQKQVKVMSEIIINLNFEVFKIRVEVQRLSQAVTKTVGDSVSIIEEQEGSFESYFEKYFAHRLK